MGCPLTATLSLTILNRWTFGGRTFDFIRAGDLIQSIGDRSKLVRQVRRSLKAGGWLELACEYIWPCCDDSSLPSNLAFEKTCAASLQIYSSAMIFVSQTSIARNIYGQFPTWVRRCPITPAKRSAELHFRCFCCRLCYTISNHLWSKLQPLIFEICKTAEVSSESFSCHRSVPDAYA